LDHPREAEREGCRRISADPMSLPQASRTDLAGVTPTLKTPGRHRREPIHLHDAALVFKAYDELEVNALTLEHVLRDT